MKNKIVIIVLIFFKIIYLQAEIVVEPSSCDCKYNYELNSGNLSTNFILPFQVYLFFDTKQKNVSKPQRKCHAIVLDKSWLLSVADCVEKDDLKKNNIFVGLPSNGNRFLDYSDLINKPDTYTIEKILIHPNYSEAGTVENQLLYNFAILKLKTPFKKDVYMKKIKPACISLNRYLRIKDEESFFVVGDSSLKTSCFHTGAKMKEDKLFYSSLEEYSFMIKYCIREYVMCFNSENLDTCLNDFGNPLYVKEESITFIVGLHIAPKFLNSVYQLNTKCSRSLTNYFSIFYNAIAWIEKNTKDALCKVIKREEKKNQKPKKKPILKKFSKIEKNCECNFEKLYNIIGNESFFDGKKHIKRYNTPKNYFRHLVQIIEHNLFDQSDPYRFICTGVIINEDYVLTTGECTNNTDLKNLYIYFGPQNLETLENLNSVFLNFASKVIEQIYHPFYIPNSGIFYNDLQILKTKIPVEDRSEFLKPACFANEKELEKKSSDKLLVASFLLLGDFENHIIDLKQKSNVEFIILNYTINFYQQGVDQCDTLICIPTKVDADLGTEGTPLHRFTESSLEVSGLMKKNVLPVFYKLHRFVPLTSNMRWIKSVVGQFNYCERKELNRYFDKKICKCDYSISNIFEPNPFTASIIGYWEKSVESVVFICSSVILNEFWVLTTYSCINDARVIKSNIYVSLSIRKKGSHFETDFFENNAFGYLYSAKKIIENSVTRLVLIKTNEKLLLGKYSEKYAGCFYRKDRNVDFSKLLLVESYLQTVEAKFDPSCNCVSLNKKVCFENEGSPISSVDDSVESAVVGLFSVYKIIDFQIDYECTEDTKKKDNFIPIQDSLEWINENIGENNYCHIENHFFDQKSCGCQNQSVVAIVKEVYASKTKYIEYVCRGVVVNSFWILTTASCVEGKFKLKINLDYNFEKGSYKYLKEIAYIHIHPRLKQIFNTYGIFDGIEFNLALLRLRKPIRSNNELGIQASCFTENKNITNFLGFFSRLQSMNNTEVLWKQFFYEDFQDLSFTKPNSNVLPLVTHKVVCDSDQGEPIRKIYPLGTMTIGLIPNTDKRYYINNKQTCDRSLINPGIFIDITDPWFKDKVESHGVCVYEKYSEYKIKNRCQCDYEGQIPGFLIGERIFNGTKENHRQIRYFQFMAFVAILVSENVPYDSILREYRFLSSAVVLSPDFVLSAATPVWKKEKPVLIDNSGRPTVVGFSKFSPLGEDIAVISENEVINVVRTFVFGGTDLVLLKVDNRNYKFMRYVRSPCISFFKFLNFDKGKLIGVGFGSTKVYEILDENNKVLVNKVSSHLDNFYSFLEFTNNLTEVSIRNPKIDISCKDSYICVTSFGAISNYDIGGPLLYLKGKTIELVGTMTVENNNLPGPYQVFRFRRLSYYAEKIKKIASHRIDCLRF